uniref:Uncharacterized protein n=1 Tax=viral metagenome TaxID=1070528 RepID=A0A6H1ZX85_9ZZZZ
MSYEPCSNCEGKKGLKCNLCKGKGWVFYEPEYLEDCENMKAFGDSLKDWIK